jgi:hypothetical protein
MPEIDVGPFVNAGGLPAQVALAVPLSVTPLMAMSQVATPAAIVPALKLIVDGAIRATLPVQPAPTTTPEAPGESFNPDGRVSVKAMPVCDGLPALLVRRKLRPTVLPAAIDALANAFVSTGTPPAGVAPTVMDVVFDDTDCNVAPTNCVLDAVF